MKFFVFVALALLGCATAAQLPDSATQGPNPQDIATPEPEYIDIDEPLPAAPAPRPVAQRPLAVSPVPRPVIGLPRPVARPIAVAQPIVYAQQPIQQRAQYLAPVVQPQQVAGHAYSSQAGYQYRRPVYVRRVYRQRRY
ncbi:hypothetical protein AWZ03_000176 [Drosophila navojoa]|uniref:DUF4794 domain-containing protein n=1 Tax=Drosophila navojoa TaxID=7232 RepID=A0A484C2I7_DRONA|nr:uncharacterized protein LOC108651948 [Drosophila navojoa]TDG53361.1 hypothetical protein AWZ03_000176 [Drosophila navojoa]